MEFTGKQKLETAKKQYRAYGEVTHFLNFKGEPMPEFEDLPAKIKEAWIEAARVGMEEGIFIAQHKAAEDLFGKTRKGEI
jgi:hypothetical protein